jgi:hypothetical protein
MSDDSDFDSGGVIVYRVHDALITDTNPPQIVGHAVHVVTLGHRGTLALGDGTTGLIETQPLHQQVRRADAADAYRPGAIRDLVLDIGRGHLGPIRPAAIRLLQSPGDSPLACLSCLRNLAFARNSSWCGESLEGLPTEIKRFVGDFEFFMRPAQKAQVQIRLDKG